MGRLAPSAPGFQVVGEVQHLLEVVARPRPDRREVPALEALRDVDHRADPSGR
jgi:hypothetical protein